MIQTNEINKWYVSLFDEFERNLNGESKSPVHQIRKKAIEDFSQLSFPTNKNEEWRFTNIAPLLKHKFKPAINTQQISREEVNRFRFKGMKCSFVVFENGFYNEELSDIRSVEDQITIKSLSAAIKENNPQIQKHFNKYADTSTQIFTALSTAYIMDGVFIHMPEGKVIDEPIHVLFLSSSKGDEILSHPRNLIITEKNSQVLIIEHYAGTDNSIYFTNSVTEIFAGENSVVHHTKIQEESKSSFHIGRMETVQDRNSFFTSNMVSLGGAISRNDFNTKFIGPGGESELNGLFLTDGSQLFDAHTLIDHASPHCNSHELYKGILDDKSRGVFNGKVIVRKDAQKTNAFQENNNIILSNEALVNTKPQLEIFADDVKCSHGATVGQLDNEALFYLKSRGIGEEKSRDILIHAFASDVVRRIKIDKIKEHIENILTEKFSS
ncbi:MAG: Fe-S cluster assembly protein SufD [Ignavibacteriaceae bacterium]|nr:Fe-S cluster assembly protein SufD [Ignavibacteriaceae bacterium]